MAKQRGCPLYQGSDCPFNIEIVPAHVFVAYPFRRHQLRKTLAAVADTLNGRVPPVAVDFVYADNRLVLNAQMLCKICQNIQSSRLCLCDLRGPDLNINVAIECGLALGKGTPVIPVFRKKDRPTLPADLAGLDSLEFRSYLQLTQELLQKLPEHLVDVPPHVEQRAAPVEQTPALETAFAGTQFDESNWCVETGDVTMIRQDDGLWIEWGNKDVHSRSGYLTLKHPLPAHFEVTADLHFTDLGIGWDPGALPLRGHRH